MRINVRNVRIVRNGKTSRRSCNGVRARRFRTTRWTATAVYYTFGVQRVTSPVRRVFENPRFEAETNIESGEQRALIIALFRVHAQHVSRTYLQCTSCRRVSRKQRFRRMR